MNITVDSGHGVITCAALSWGELTLVTYTCVYTCTGESDVERICCLAPSSSKPKMTQHCKLNSNALYFYCISTHCTRDKLLVS